MSNVMDYYLLFSAVNSVNNPIVPNTNSIKVLAAFQLNRLMRKQRRSFSTDGFGTTSKEAIFLQSAFQFLETDRFLVPALGHHS